MGGADESPPEANISREVFVFYAPTVAIEEDTVLGEGDALAFIREQEARKLGLAISASYVLPLFLDSAEYRQLTAR